MRRFSFSLLLAFMLCQAEAQYFESGACVGVANYSGELSEQRISTSGFNSMLGVFGRYNADKWFAIKASLTYAQINGSDKNARLESNRLRNLSFRSDLLELGMTGEINFSAYNIRANKTGVPYFFMGWALTYFNPQAQMRGAWYDLQPLQTETERYKRVTVAVPFGLGLKFNLSYKVNFGLEVGARKTFTDHLDDVSGYYPDVLAMRSHDQVSAALSYRSPELTGQFGENPEGQARGNQSNKDWYFFAGATVSVNLADKYGIDFDPKYDVFKNNSPALKENQPEQVCQKRGCFLKNLCIFKKRTEMKPVVKKRTK